MKTIKDYMRLLRGNEGNTVLGLHLNHIFNEKCDDDATVHHVDEKIEVICQMNKNGINAFTDSYKLGSVNKAYHQWMLSHYEEF